jgi:CTP:molybdopterin cytidylyltransferase MocA
MGRPKLLLPWGGSTVLGHLVTTWRELGAAQIAVVTAPLTESQSRAGVPPAQAASRPEPPGAPGTGQAGRLPYFPAATKPAPPRIASELDRLGIGPRDCIENPQPQLGMFSSVRCAAQWPGWQPSLTHWLLSLGDQPHVQTTTLRALLEFASQHPAQICQPARRGRPRHPVLLPRDVFGELARTPAENLKDFLLAWPDRCLSFESGDAGLDFDLDEPADYVRALKELGAR